MGRVGEGGRGVRWRRYCEDDEEEDAGGMVVGMVADGVDCRELDVADVADEDD